MKNYTLSFVNDLRVIAVIAALTPVLAHANTAGLTDDLMIVMLAFVVGGALLLAFALAFFGATLTQNVLCAGLVVLAIVTYSAMPSTDQSSFHAKPALIMFVALLVIYVPCAIIANRFAKRMRARRNQA